FRQIEKFLGKTIDKNPLPDGLGETPNYDAPASKDGRRSFSTGGKRRRNNFRPADKLPAKGDKQGGKHRRRASGHQDKGTK
ncbi:MAG: hypothetical protein LUC22_00995, partial [Prevotella sp.]|nr:hypothetical protein [Prevotella sp.]